MHQPYLLFRHSSHSQPYATVRRAQADRYEPEQYRTQEAQAWQSSYPISHHEWAPLTAITQVELENMADRNPTANTFTWTSQTNASPSPSVDTENLYNSFLAGCTQTANPTIAQSEGRDSSMLDYYHGQDVPIPHYIHPYQGPCSSAFAQHWAQHS